MSKQSVSIGQVALVLLETRVLCCLSWRNCDRALNSKTSIRCIDWTIVDDHEWPL